MNEGVVAVGWKEDSAHGLWLPGLVSPQNSFLAERFIGTLIERRMGKRRLKPTI
jgi:hypothetical protein